MLSIWPICLARDGSVSCQFNCPMRHYKLQTLCNFSAIQTTYYILLYTLGERVIIKYLLLTWHFGTLNAAANSHRGVARQGRGDKQWRRLLKSHKKPLRLIAIIHCEAHGGRKKKKRIRNTKKIRNKIKTKAVKKLINCGTTNKSKICI